MNLSLLHPRKPLENGDMIYTVGVLPFMTFHKVGLIELGLSNEEALTLIENAHRMVVSYIEGRGQHFNDSKETH